MTKGYIPIERKLFDVWPWKTGEAFTVRCAWIDLVQMATYQSRTEVTIKGDPICLTRGQIAASQRFLMERWKWSNSKVRRMLSQLQNNGMITLQKNQGQTVINICKYDLYYGGRIHQKSEKTAEKPALDARKTTEKLSKEPNTNKVKKVRKENKVKNVNNNIERGDPVEKAISLTLEHYQQNPEQKRSLLNICGFRERVHGNFETEVRKFWLFHYEKDNLLREPLKHLKRFQSWLLKAKEFNQPTKQQPAEWHRSGPYKLL